MLIKSIFIHVLVRFWLFANNPSPTPVFIHSFLPHSLSFLWLSTFCLPKSCVSLIQQMKKKQKNLEICAGFGILQIKTSPCIVPVIANQLFLGSNRRVLSPNQAAINKLSPAPPTAKPNQNGAVFVSDVPSDQWEPSLQDGHSHPSIECQRVSRWR